MTVEAVNHFLTRVSEDEKLQQDLANILEAEGNDRTAATELGAKYGYQFTPDELWQEISNRQSEFQQRQQAEELSEDELEAVAGGGTPGLATGISAGVAAVTGGFIAKAKW
jgi:predicted ribosomally synthesized peptide with nif11-like leader